MANANGVGCVEKKARRGGICFSSHTCCAHVSSHSPLAKTSRRSPHNPSDYFERKTDCQQSSFVNIYPLDSDLSDG